MVNIGNDWQSFFDSEMKKPYYLELREKLKEEYKNYTVYPKMENIFNAFRLTPISNIKVVIIGQDPYHGYNQAIGLSFSVNDGVKVPPSLKNIFKEIDAEMGAIGFSPNKKDGNLERWARQGVFLLNSTLTVRKGEANSHSKIGWQIFTDNAIRVLNNDNNPKVFMLWGSYARSKAKMITNCNHLILESAHPSPLSAHNGFFGNQHFNLCNDFLARKGIKPIDWR